MPPSEAIQELNEAGEVKSCKEVHAGDVGVEEVADVSELRVERSGGEVFDEPDAEEVDECAVPAIQEAQEVEEETYFEETRALVAKNKEEPSSQERPSENVKRSLSSQEEAGPSKIKRRKTSKPKSRGGRKSARSSGKKKGRESEDSDKKNKKRKRSPQNAAENDVEMRYEVERIVDHTVYRVSVFLVFRCSISYWLIIPLQRIVVSYEVKWTGYPESENTTEPAQILHR